MTYVAAEPEQVTRFIDTNGVSHEEREDAINANFEIDLKMKVKEHFAYNNITSCTVEQMLNTIKDIVSHNPDMVRVLLGDRDAT